MIICLLYRTEQPGVEVVRAFGQGIAKFLGLEVSHLYFAIHRFINPEKKLVWLSFDYSIGNKNIYVIATNYTSM